MNTPTNETLAKMGTDAHLIECIHLLRMHSRKHGCELHSILWESKDGTLIININDDDEQCKTEAYANYLMGDNN